MNFNPKFPRLILSFTFLGCFSSATAMTAVASGDQLSIQGTSTDNILIVSCDDGVYSEQRFTSGEIPTYVADRNAASCKYELRSIPTDGKTPEVSLGFFSINEGIIRLHKSKYSDYMKK